MLFQKRVETTYFTLNNPMIPIISQFNHFKAVKIGAVLTQKRKIKIATISGTRTLLACHA